MKVSWECIWIRTDRRRSEVAQENSDFEQDNAETGTDEEAYQSRYGKMPCQGVARHPSYGEQHDSARRDSQSGKPDFVFTQGLFQ